MISTDIRFPGAIAMSKQERNAVKDAPPAFIPHCAATTARGYTCPELRPFTGRPGAMDAFKLKSRGDGC